MKSNFHADLHVYRLSVLQCGLKAPLLHRFNRLRVQPKPQATDDLNVAWLAGIIDDHPQNALSLRLGEACLFGVLRIRGRNSLWGGDAAADFEHTTTRAAAATGAHSRSVTHAHSTA